MVSTGIWAVLNGYILQTVGCKLPHNWLVGHLFSCFCGFLVCGAQNSLNYINYTVKFYILNRFYLAETEL